MTQHMRPPALRHGPLTGLRAECAAWFLPAGHGLRDAAAQITALFPDTAPAFGQAFFTGALQQTLMLFPHGGKVRRLILVGLGEPARIDAERLRRAATAAVRAAELQHAASLTLLEPRTALLPPELAGGADAAAEALLEGALLAAYRYDTHRTRDREAGPRLRRILYHTDRATRLRPLRPLLRRVTAVCAATWMARDLENAPANELYPDSLGRVAVRAGRAAGFRVRVLGPRRLRALGMSGLLAVSAGSHKPPRLLLLEYRGAGKRRQPVVLVGKGVTFDSGGISIKPSAGMAEMKMDMSGAAAVLGTLHAAASLRLPVNLVGMIPATENMPGGGALKPGDIIRHGNGLTSEVDNTDAEGRLILADALAYAARLRPDVIIDLATLTGAVVVALGHVVTGMMGTDRQTMEDLIRSGERTYERVWQLPLFDEYERLIRSDVADIKNVGGKWAGAITGAMFLKQFAGDRHWVHLDIAGTAMLEEAFEYLPKGGSGVGVRLLVDFLRTRTRERRS